jgi:hypothetical protein
MQVPSYLEFFAGGGMVRAGLGARWKCLFANDLDPLKVQVYADNWGEKEILEEDIHKVTVEDVPRRADLAWALVRTCLRQEMALVSAKQAAPSGHGPAPSGPSSI